MTYEIIEREGQKVRLYPDGSIRDSNGRFIVRPQAAIDHAITSENAAILANKRYEDTKQAVREAVLAEVSAHERLPAHTPIHAYAAVVAKQTQTLWDTDKPRFDDVRELGQIMDLVPRKQAEAQQQQPQDTLLRDALLGLVQAIEQRVQDTIPMRSEIIDVDPE